MSKMQWQRTKKQFLIRDKISGRYYARFFSDGKQHWISLKTDSFVVAEAKLAEKLKEFKKARKTSQSVERGTATVEQVARTYLDNQGKRPEIKVSTAHYREQLVNAILKTWPELKTAKPRDVSESDCQAWASRFAPKYSPTRFNNAVDTMRGIFRVAIDHGMIYRNPAENLGKRRPSKKHLTLPSQNEFSAIVKSVREQGAWCSKQCGDLIEFLAFTGCRLDEARHIRWSDVTEDGIWIHGGETGTKSHESRFLPFNPALRRLVDDLREHPRYYRGDRREYVLAVSECQKAIDATCTKLNADRFTHHDLRHLFATRAISSGVDIPTVAKWLGHKDGGALLMKTYSHLLKEHSQAMAAKVAF